MTVRRFLAVLVLSFAVLLMLSGALSVPVFAVEYLFRDHLPLWLSGGVTSVIVFAVYIAGTAWVVSAILGRKRLKDE